MKRIAALLAVLLLLTIGLSALAEDYTAGAYTLTLDEPWVCMETDGTVYLFHDDLGRTAGGMITMHCAPREDFTSCEDELNALVDAVCDIPLGEVFSEPITLCGAEGIRFGYNERIDLRLEGFMLWDGETLFVLTYTDDSGKPEKMREHVLALCDAVSRA